jgi:hypothetical protein
MEDKLIIPRAKRGRIPDAVRSLRIRIDGNRKRGIDARQDKTFAWLDQIPEGKRFDFVWDLITAALNGELGPAMQVAVEESDVEKARAAASQIVGAFVVDDDE